LGSWAEAFLAVGVERTIARRRKTGILSSEASMDFVSRNRRGFLALAYTRLACAGLACAGLGCGSSGGEGEPPKYEDVTALGKGDGSPSSVVLTLVHEAPNTQPVDLAFSAVDPSQLWVMRYATLATLVLVRPGTPEQEAKVIADPDAIHFANKTPAIAWGEGNTWATCGDNTNPISKNNLFMGPALFSGDLSVFAKATPKGLGSHLDMLHASPLCRGIAHERANVYWVFNAYDKSIDRYDFHRDHGPGEDDHSDGEIYRYAKDQVLGKDGIPSHIAYSPDDAMLYVADTGNARVAKLDTRSGTKGEPLPRRNEPLVGNAMMSGAAISDFVPKGTLEAPTGIEVRSGAVYVSDNATSKLWAFERSSGKVIRTLDTGLPKGSLTGFTFGPDGKIWLCDKVASRVYRIDPK
jgi:hypothetical protein